MKKPEPRKSDVDRSSQHAVGTFASLPLCFQGRGRNKMWPIEAARAAASATAGYRHDGQCEMTLHRAVAASF